MLRFQKLDITLYGFLVSILIVFLILQFSSCINQKEFTAKQKSYAYIITACGDTIYMSNREVKIYKLDSID